MLITPFAYTLALSVFTLGAADVAFGVDVEWGKAWVGVPLGVLGALAFAPFALVFSAITLAFKQAPGQGAVLPSLSLVSGLYFPVALLPGWIRWLSEVQPLTPAVDLMRHVLVGFPLEGDAGWELVRLGAFVVAGLPLGVWAVSAARRFSRARGTVLES